MAVTLEVIDGPERGRSFTFDAADSFLIGRSPNAHLCLDPVADPFISRTHCLLELRPPRCILIDLGSTNGTRLNERPVQTAQVSAGDVIRVGHTAIRVLLRGEPAPTSGTASFQECAEADRNTIDPQPGPAQASPEQGTTACHGCGADVTAAAAADLLDHRHQEPLYLCQSCIHREIDTTISEKRIGAYRILGEIGRGGMGVVYRAAHKVSGRLCAVKQLLPDTASDETARRRFEREIDVQTQVEHPHLVRVWDRARDEDEILYFVTEYLAGGDLERYASKEVCGPVEPALACSLISQLLEGLQELHRRGMIHRDLKPANLLISRPPDDPRCVAKISDYGLAKCFEEAGNSVFAYTSAGHVAGSLMFMAPEQITNFRFVRPPADVYSLGVSLYYLITATYPMDFLAPTGDRGPGAARIRHPVEVIVEDPPVPLLERRSTVPLEIAAVVDRAVLKNQNERYQAAGEFHDELQRAGRSLGWW